MAIISVFEAQNACRRSIMVDSTPVDHPNAAWDSGYRGPKFASSPVVPEDPTAPNFAHPDQIFPKFGALRAPNFVSGFWGSGNPKFSGLPLASVLHTLARLSARNCRSGTAAQQRGPKDASIVHFARAIQPFCSETSRLSDTSRPALLVPAVPPQGRIRARLGTRAR